ncbi:hypothetical protein HDE_00823 [Halotydeus destructor]|nr:hypothetical protein HDE_00823 [Halotydeus destructor]
MAKFAAIALLAFAAFGTASATAIKPVQEMNNKSSLEVTPSEIISVMFSLLKDDSVVESTANGLSRVDASLRSALGAPLTGLVYAASLAVGVVTLLAFYESPLSPLPVPSLPKPPVGRFPPEHPIWPPISKHPVKMNGGDYGAASHLQQAFVLPNIQGKNPFAGYDKAGSLSNYANQAYGVVNGIEHNNYGNNNQFQGAASNVYSTIVSPPNGKRVNHNIQALANNQPQAPIFQRKSEVPSASIVDNVQLGSSAEVAPQAADSNNNQ